MLRDQLAAMTIKDEQREDEFDQYRQIITELEEEKINLEAALNEEREQLDRIDQVRPIPVVH